MKVQVTDDHIDDARLARYSGQTGDKGDFDASRHCPIALAMNEADPKHKHYVFGSCYRYVGDEVATYRGNLPPECEAFVEAFDQGFRVEPFTFTAHPTG